MQIKIMAVQSQCKYFYSIARSAISQPAKNLIIATTLSFFDFFFLFTQIIYILILIKARNCIKVVTGEDLILFVLKNWII